MSKIDYKLIIERQVLECEELIHKSEICDSNVKAQSFLFQRLEKPRIDVAKSRINNLKEALKRIEIDRFGICKTCKKKIPDRDLLVLPERMFCGPCSEFGVKSYEDTV